MEWFSAIMLFVAKTEGETPTNAPFKDSIRVFRARDAAHAAVRAEAVGRAAGGESRNEDGQTVRWTFVNVIEVINLHENVLEDGTEVFWIWEERAHEDDPTWTGAQAPRRSAEVSDLAEPSIGWRSLALTWFCAQISSVCQVDGQLPSTFAESYRVFRARDMAHAALRAPDVGLLEETDYENDLGETVRWTFLEVIEVQDLGASTLEDGTEVFSILHGGESEEDQDPDDAQAPAEVG